MNVRELIEELSKLPSEAPVILAGVVAEDEDIGMYGWTLNRIEVHMTGRHSLKNYRDAEIQTDRQDTVVLFSRAHK